MGQISPPVRFCIIWKESWGLVQAIKVPEAKARLYTDHTHGWKVLIRDSDFPVPADGAPLAPPVPVQSNPCRSQADGDDGREDAHD